MTQNRSIIQKQKIWFVFLIVLFLKTPTVFLLSHLSQCSAPERSLGKLAYASGDTFSYTGAMENLIQRDSYYFHNGKENVYAGRLPHYSIPFWFFRQMFDQPTSYDLVVIFQILMELLGTVALCLIAFQFFGNRGLYLLLLFMLLSTSWTDSAYYISPESLSTSVLALCLWQFEIYRSEKKTKNLFWSGVFFAWLTTLKVYYLLLLLPVGLELLFSESSALNKLTTWKSSTAKSFLYVLPLVVLLTPWMIRNYFVYQRVIPFQVNQFAGYNYTESDLACRKFIAAWGGDFVYWEKSSAGCYFHPRQEGVVCEFKYPESMFSDQLRKGEVDSVRTEYIVLQQNYSPEADQKISKHFDLLTKRFKASHPGYYYVLGPLQLTVKFLKHSGSYYLPIHPSNPCFHQWQYVVKVLESVLYWMSLLLGIPGLIWFGIKQKNILLPYLPCFLILLFPILFRTTEWRYFRTIEPILFIGIVYVILRFTHLLKNYLPKG